MSNEAAPAQGLQVANAAILKQEMTAEAPKIDKELEAKADNFVQALLSLDPKDVTSRGDGKNAVENMGLELQKKSAQQSQMLQQPVKDLSKRADESGDVGNALINLKMEVEALDPSGIDLEPGWFSRVLGSLPGVGTPLKRYFSKYESAQTVIAAIIRSLEKGRDQLGRDNTTLAEDQKRMQEITKKLEQVIQLSIVIDQKLQKKLDSGELAAGSDQHRFVAEELVFPLRQRIIDLQQQLAVNQQGILATEIIIRNNRELIRGVNRALNVTVSALQVGATVAIALGNQKDVLDKVENVNKTTSDLIAGTANRLKTQGAAIHKQAASAQLDMEKLRGAFADIKIAMEDIASFRMNALPQMATTVLELDKLTKDSKEAIEKMEKGNRAKPKITVEV